MKRIFLPHLAASVQQKWEKKAKHGCEDRRLSEEQHPINNFGQLLATAHYDSGAP